MFVAIQIILYIPIIFITKAIGINTLTLVLEIPIRVSASSSGSGETIIKAAISGESHRKKPKRNECKTFFTTEGLIDAIKFLDNRSLIKKNRSKSPHTAPNAPQIVIVINDSEPAALVKTNKAGTIVNAEVQNIPAIKLIMPTCSNILTNQAITPNFERVSAIIMPNKIKSKSFLSSCRAIFLCMWW